MPHDYGKPWVSPPPLWTHGRLRAMSLFGSSWNQAAEWLCEEPDPSMIFCRWSDIMDGSCSRVISGIMNPFGIIRIIPSDFIDVSWCIPETPRIPTSTPQRLIWRDLMILGTTCDPLLTEVHFGVQQMFTSNDHGTFWALPHCCLKSQTVDIDYTILFCTRPEQELLTGLAVLRVLDPCTFCAVQFQPAWNRSPEDMKTPGHMPSVDLFQDVSTCILATGRRAKVRDGESNDPYETPWVVQDLLHRIAEDWSIGRLYTANSWPNLGMVGMERSKRPVGKCATGSPTTALQYVEMHAAAMQFRLAYTVVQMDSIWLDTT